MHAQWRATDLDHARGRLARPSANNERTQRVAQLVAKVKTRTIFGASRIACAATCSAGRSLPAAGRSAEPCGRALVAGANVTLARCSETFARATYLCM